MTSDTAITIDDLIKQGKHKATAMHRAVAKMVGWHSSDTTEVAVANRCIIRAAKNLGYKGDLARAAHVVTEELLSLDYDGLYIWKSAPRR